MTHHAPTLAALLLLSLTACDHPDRSDPYLADLATQESAKLTAEYNRPAPDWYMILWTDGGTQCFPGTDVILISRAIAGNEQAVRWHIRHELRHLMGCGNPDLDVRQL